MSWLEVEIQSHRGRPLMPEDYGEAWKASPQRTARLNSYTEPRNHKSSTASPTYIHDRWIPRLGPLIRRPR
ncbi:MAG: hypothetical protein A2186_00770 [Candidatus Levybacteria bacterium RIFOXYA1_FULL_41_10]|nr:MAG: hypothetical protein A2695_02105 [Candidatus Levybacteria bacterium RIFCSPHIGHO2_01_FULL_40_83]OGH25241.1 MAG: hypothetical protein A3D82_03095 [Candidatus Levybacteria bacterium RIFCSPHIGHO2_02_FULL_40_29]OGH32856.1 MAG: hypothetical protein A3E70_02565 [Candidatus Levybacteria bacterium RIFCSPHIGHO2_12_FULL_40_44]OGH41096.1 MAG: hypothetical protein A2965_01405 [Candidatus Levybacteria bacterium RIFCSPLOWO2_01_FULL_40_96]OGH50670.1 MAG: hypothetical protein A3J18_00720 [Candidatus Lev